MNNYRDLSKTETICFDCLRESLLRASSEYSISEMMEHLKRTYQFNKDYMCLDDLVYDIVKKDHHGCEKCDYRLELVVLDDGNKEKH